MTAEFIRSAGHTNHRLLRVDMGNHIYLMVSRASDLWYQCMHAITPGFRICFSVAVGHHTPRLAVEKLQVVARQQGPSKKTQEPADLLEARGQSTHSHSKAAAAVDLASLLDCRRAKAGQHRLILCQVPQKGRHFGSPWCLKGIILRIHCTQVGSLVPLVADPICCCLESPAIARENGCWMVCIRLVQGNCSCSRNAIVQD